MIFYDFKIENEIVIRLKTIKYKENSFHYLFFYVFLSGHTFKSSLFLSFKSIFRFYLIDYAIKFYYNSDVIYY